MTRHKSIVLLATWFLFKVSIGHANGPLDFWMATTMLVQNERGGKGTGFLVSRKMGDDRSRIFLVTNKHVLNDNDELRKDTRHITLFLNEKDSSGRVKLRAYQIIFDNKNEWREHPDKNIDVLAIDVTNLILDNKNISHKTASYEIFANNPDTHSPIYVNVGDDVLVIGYPLGLTQSGEPLPVESLEGSALPIVRQGILSTPIKSRIDGLSGFLIDGAVIPGSSGSPVILKPRYGYLRGNEWIMGSQPAALLGIVSGTKLKRDTHLGDFTWQTNMGVVYNTDTIKDTVELFFK